MKASSMRGLSYRETGFSLSPRGAECQDPGCKEETANAVRPPEGEERFQDWMLGVGLLTQGGLWPLRPCPPLTERPLGRGAAGSPGPHRLSRGMAALEPLDLASCLSRKPPDFLLALRRSTRCYQKEGHLHTRSSSQCRLRAGRWPRGACSPDPGWSRAHGLRGSCSQEPTARWPVGTGRPRAEACGSERPICGLAKVIRSSLLSPDIPPLGCPFGMSMGCSQGLNQEMRAISQSYCR